MDNLLEYKCPCCGGAISFDSASQELKCPYCDTSFKTEDLKGYDEDLKAEGVDEMDWQSMPGRSWMPDDEKGLRSYICKSCGGEILGDETLGATSCPYCGNPVIVKEKFAGGLMPDYVIPFKLDRKSAKEGFYNHLKGKILLPKVFKTQTHIDEIKGIYVPFWLYSADSDAKIRYKATRVAHWEDADFIYTKTSFYSLYREGSLSFAHVPVDGSDKIDNNITESLEPYNFNDAVDFQTAYLAGYFADKYNVDAENSVGRANDRIKRSTEVSIANTIHGYTTVNAESTTMQLKNQDTKYALYPVWLLNTTWKNKKYTFAMNGQTGKFVGDLPVDYGAFWRWLGLLALGISAVAFCILTLISYL